MAKLRELHPQFITDEEGRRTSVILPIEEFEDLLEEMDDLVAVAERRAEPTISHEELLDELRKDGFIQD